MYSACYGGTLNSRRAASALVMLEERKERGEVPAPLQCVLPQNWGGTIMPPVGSAKLWITTGVDLVLHHDEFRGPRSDTFRHKGH
ncbi:hypothetical protein TNCV_4571161 [Trichonephila clavipes]|nr:hypothetical protein TNCV_4571161 [Trichonephila clavipes]